MDTDRQAGGRVGMILATLVAALAGVACSPTDSRETGAVSDALVSYHEARAVVEGALEAMGGRDAIGRAGGLLLEGRGVLDLGVRLQGRLPFEPEAHELVERMALDRSAGRVVFETRGAINPDAQEWLRYDYRPGAAYVVDMLTRRAYPSREDGLPRIERMVPHLLLAEVLASGSSLRDVGERDDGDGRRRVVAWTAPGGTALTLHFDSGTRVLREIEYVTDMPVRGDVLVKWRYGEYMAVEGLGSYPSGYEIDIDGSAVRSIRYERAAAGNASDLFLPPGDVRFPEPPPASPVPPAASAQEPEVESFGIRDIAPGVYLLPNVRGGFHMMFVEFADFVLAVDAPAGWLELHELPSAIAYGPRGSTAVGERYLRAIRSRVPDKPVRHVVLTHHHDDHAGGVRAFIEAGATVLAAPETRPVVDSAIAGPHTLAGVPAGARSLTPRFEPVIGRHVVSDSLNEVHIIDVGDNPHASGMLAIHLPRHHILYVADLFEPAGDTFPSPARLPVMRWFVRWLDESGLDPERIYSVHGRALVESWQLDLIRSLPDTTSTSS